MSINALCRPLKVLQISNRSFRSALSIDKLYPQSVDVKPFVPPTNEDGLFAGYIPIKRLQINYVCASGPGGQHVNKTRTKVDVRFHVESADWLLETTRQKILSQHYSKINKEGYLVLRSDKTKFSHLNLADVMARLRDIIYKLEMPKPEPKPDTEERIRKFRERAARHRLMEKRHRSRIKEGRQT